MAFITNRFDQPGYIMYCNLWNSRDMYVLHMHVGGQSSTTTVRGKMLKEVLKRFGSFNREVHAVSVYSELIKPTA